MKRKRLIRVAPSINAIDFNNEEILLKALKDIEKAGANFVHIDVMDGKFVKSKTFDYTFVDKIRDKTHLLFDVHLMVKDPDNDIDKYIKAGADIVTVHYEACKDVVSVLKKIKSRNVLAGIAISPNTPVLKIKDIIESKLVDVITVMSVEPGASGQKFIPKMAEKISEIRELNKRVFIEIDGGVNLSNASMLRKLGVNILVSGSCIFKSTDMKKTINALKGKGFFNQVKDFFN
ncbi:MAG: ribulose-phosphate 3-epimerase [Clostridia bacterium]|nr:ribulose-phosphate 3-epimerase [Clostridia bacterium]